MHRYKYQTNIPMEGLRSIVCIADEGSLSKAAPLLGLSQPALSSQIKKIEGLVGGNIFSKTAGGSTVTELGKLVVVHARRIIESNDQLLRLRGSSDLNQNIRVGISNLYATMFFQRKGSTDFSRITVVADLSPALVTSLRGGFIDAALVLLRSNDDLDPSLRIVEEREVHFTWVRSKDFVLSPGAPIPILTWPGHITGEVMTRALEDAGMIYKIALSSPDHHATLAAARAGTGLMILPVDMPELDLVRAKEYYLPALKPIKLLLCERADAPIDRSFLRQFISETFFHTGHRDSGAQQTHGSQRELEEQSA